jgi:hypothetical protein
MKIEDILKAIKETGSSGTAECRKSKKHFLEYDEKHDFSKGIKLNS